VSLEEDTNTIEIVCCHLRTKAKGRTENRRERHEADRHEAGARGCRTNQETADSRHEEEDFMCVEVKNR
jgi:hypothetical protein